MVPRNARAVPTFLISALLAGAAEAAPEDLTILVGPKDGPLAARAAEPGTVTVGRLFLALDRAAAHLVACKTCVVTIRVAGGDQPGKAQVAQWRLPETPAPGATLRIFGGYDPTFAKRAPFWNPTVLVTEGRRSGPVLDFTGRKTALKELWISGFAIDVGSGNSYDAKSGALMKGASSSWPILAVGGITVERLIIADNIFANAANGVGGPRVNAASPQSEIVVRNNLFVSNVHTWQVVGLPRTPAMKRYLVQGNSFIANYPYNPDATTSNPGTVEIGGSDTAGLVELRGNLFAHNVGGAIFPQWDDSRGPKMMIAENLFFRNDGLFGKKGDGAGALVGKFNGSARHGSFTPSEVEEEFSWSSTANVVMDPGIDPRAPAKVAEEDEGEDPGEEGDGIQVVRSEAIDTFAPRFTLDPKRLPLPRTEAAQKYGASPARVVTP